MKGLTPTMRWQHPDVEEWYRKDELSSWLRQNTRGSERNTPDVCKGLV